MTIRKWTEKDNEYLRENYKEKTDKELAEEINRTRNSICQQRLKMGLKKDKRSRKENHPASFGVVCGVSVVLF